MIIIGNLKKEKETEESISKTVLEQALLYEFINQKKVLTKKLLIREHDYKQSTKHVLPKERRSKRKRIQR